MGRLGLLAALAVLAGAPASAAPAAAGAQAPRHVVTIVLGAKDFKQAFGRRSELPYLARTLRAKGTLLPAYAAISRAPLANRLAMVAGVRPTAATRAGCPQFDCAAPADVKTLPDQLEAAGRTWRAYVQDLPAPCPVPVDGHGDPFRAATASSQYATAANPFAYFHSITDRRAACLRHVVPLRALRADLRAAATTPDWSWIAPDRCASGDDDPCADPRQAGGAEGVQRFLRRWVPRILAAPAFRQDGLLVITFASASERLGRVGALLIGPSVAAGAEHRVALDHHGYLRSMEDLFGLPALGEAARAGTATFQSAGAFG